MKTEEYIALGGLITICASALALVIKQIEGSKCETIDCFCIKCKRKVSETPEILPSDPSTPVINP